MEAKEEEKTVRITFYVPKWVRSAIKQEIADSDESQTGWLLKLVENHLNTLGYQRPVRYKSLSQLIRENRESILRRSLISAQDLDEIQQHNRCDDIDLLRIAIVLDISEQEIRLIANQPTKSKKELTTDG